MPTDAWWSGDTLSQSDNRFIDSLEVSIVVMNASPESTWQLPQKGMRIWIC